MDKNKPGGIGGFRGQKMWVWIQVLLVFFFAMETEQILGPQSLGFFTFTGGKFLPSRVFVGTT